MQGGGESMDMSYQSTFVQMFAVSWLVENFSTWHFTTLCGIFVECTMNVCPVNKSRWETLKLVLWCYRMVSVSMSLYILRCFKSRWHTNKTKQKKILLTQTVFRSFGDLVWVTWAGLVEIQWRVRGGGIRHEHFCHVKYFLNFKLVRPTCARAERLSKQPVGFLRVVWTRLKAAAPTRF